MILGDAIHNTRQYNATIQGDAMPQCNHDATIPGDTMPRYKAVNGSAEQNLRNSIMKSELTIKPGEKRGIHFTPGPA